jgi:hypothetical protein
MGSETEDNFSDVTFDAGTIHFSIAPFLPVSSQSANPVIPMIVSHERKFIFIKTAKTASTSIEIFLSKQCGPKDIVTPIRPPVEGHQPRNHEQLLNPISELIRRPEGLRPALRHVFEKRKQFYNHMPAWLVEKRIPAHAWNNYFKFCVERNPWDKVLSHYHMATTRASGSLSLDEYLAKGRFPINYFRYTDRSGTRIIVDRIVRYENLMNDLAEVLSQVNVRFEGNLGVRAKSEYRTDHTPYQSVFNDAQRKIVEQAFAREIELHGYGF